MYCTVLYCTVFCLALLPFASSFLFGQLLSLLRGQKCCGHGECYDLRPPWTTLTRLLPPPRCLENPVKYLLSNRSNPTYPVVFSPANFSLIQDYYNASKPTVIVIHGWLESENAPHVRNITGVYLKNVDANAIYVDYKKITMNVNYFQVASDLRVAARYVIKAVQSLIGLGTLPSNIHLIGFSFGAHVAAYVAKNISGIGRLTGLDPAGPGFWKQSCEVRLCKDDAVFVEAIHTNGHPVIGIGTPDESGDVDLWVNGGWDQPKCGITVNLTGFLLRVPDLNFTADVPGLACSHERAVFIYTEALASSCTLWGVQADEPLLDKSRLLFGYPTKYIINTQDCTLDNCVPIGLQTINATGRGNYIVPTNWDSPFCVSQS